MRKVKEKEKKLSSAFTKHGGYLAEDDEPEYFILPTIVAEQENIPPVVEQQNDDAEPSVEQDNQERADFNTNTAKSEESEQRNSSRSRSISVSGVRSEVCSDVRAKTKVTVEKITPAIPSRTFSRCDKVQDEQQLTRHKVQPQNANFSCASSDTQQRRIDPLKVGEFGDLLDRIQERERSRSTPRESAKKPKDYYEHLHGRGRDQQ